MSYQKVRYDHILSDHRQGDGAQVQMYGGDQGSPPAAPASGDPLLFDASGNAIGGTKTGNTNHLASAITGAKTSGNYPKWDANGNLGNGDSGAGLASGITLVIDGAGSAITTGIKADLFIDFACTITQVTLLADQSGSIVIDVWKDAYANYPPTIADSITAAAKPTISSADKSQDSTLTGWTTAISAGDSLRFNVDSVATITRVVLALKVTKG